MPRPTVDPYMICTAVQRLPFRASLLLSKKTVNVYWPNKTTTPSPLEEKSRTKKKKTIIVVAIENRTRQVRLHQSKRHFFCEHSYWYK